MNQLRRLGRSCVRWVKQFGRLPHTMATLAQRRREQAVRDEMETERLDRICNPSKYLGK